MDGEEGFGCFIKGEISASHRKGYNVIKYALSYVRMFQGKHLLWFFSNIKILKNIMKYLHIIEISKGKNCLQGDCY